MKNKKKIILLIFAIAVIVFAGLYIILNYTEPNILNSQDKVWISDNGGKVIDIDVINDIPVYSNNGSGVIFDFLDYMKEETNLDFNKIPYLKGGTNFNSRYRFEIVDGSNKISNDEILIFSDSYVAIEKTERKIKSLEDLSSRRIGVLSTDSSTISYYLENVSNIAFKDYDSVDNLFKALSNNDVSTIIAPHILNLDKTIKDEYHINYFFNNISKNVILKLDSNNESLNTIIKKVYNSWHSKKYD